MTIFSTERLTVRKFTWEDRENFFRLNGDEEIMRYIRKPRTREESDLFLRQVMADYHNRFILNLRYAVEEKRSGVFVGTFAIIPVDNSSEQQLGYALLTPAWGKGYATELTMAGIHYAFEELRLSKIVAIAEQANPASCRVLEKCGFRLEKIYEDKGKMINYYSQFLS